MGSGGCIGNTHPAEGQIDIIRRTGFWESCVTTNTLFSGLCHCRWQLQRQLNYQKQSKSLHELQQNKNSSESEDTDSSSDLTRIVVTMRLLFASVSETLISRLVEFIAKVLLEYQIPIWERERGRRQRKSMNINGTVQRKLQITSSLNPYGLFHRSTAAIHKCTCSGVHSLKKKNLSEQ